MPSALACPLCAASLASAAALETHLRLELAYTALRCLLCPREFFDEAAAEAHHTAKHPSSPLRLAELHEPRLHRRLRELLAGAGAGKRRCADCDCCRERGCGGEAKPPSPDQLRLVETESAEAADAPEKKALEEPAEEAPAPSPRRVKAELAEEAVASEERKPRAVAADGKVACLLCEARVVKANFGSHAARSHLDAHPILCNLCPYSAKQKFQVLKHLKSQHPEDGSPEAMTVLNLKAQIEGKMAECFGDVREIAEAKVTCKECQIPVRLTEKKQHAAVRHLKQVIYACRLCAFTSLHLSASVMIKHMKSKHGQALSEENADSKADQLEPIVKRMLPALFGQ